MSFPRSARRRSPCTLRSLLLCSATLLLVAETAPAQMIDPGVAMLPAARAAGPRPALLRLNLDASAGYDENVDPTGGVGFPIQAFNPQQSGRVGTGAAALHLRRGTSPRLFEVLGRTYISQATQGAEQVIGATTRLSAETVVGRRNGINLSGGVSSTPTYLFNTFGAVAADVEGGTVPGTTPSRGITGQRWLNSQLSGGVYRNVTSRQRTDVRGRYQHRDPVSGPGFTSRAVGASFDHAWRPREFTSLRVAYRLDQNRQIDDAGNPQALTMQVAESGVTWQRALSPGQMWSFTAGAGVNVATQDNSLRVARFTLPTYFASTRLGLTRTWALEVDLRRSVAVVDGLTPEPFVTDIFTGRSLSTIGRRTQLSASASFGRGRARLSDRGSFLNGVGTVQVLYSLSARYGLFGNYSYYLHRFSEVPLVPSGFPSRYELNSVRAGVTFTMPLIAASN